MSAWVGPDILDGLLLVYAEIAVRYVVFIAMIV